MRTPIVTVAALLASLLAGCAQHVYSPPGRTLPLETAATLRPGESGAQIEGGTSSAMFGPELWHLTVRGRAGVAEGTEMALEGNVLHVDGDGAGTADRNVLSLRLGTKHRLADFLSITAGVAGGHSAGGYFLSPDVGLVLAWENPFVVPFFSVRGFLSEPILARPVDVSLQDEPAGTVMATPDETWGYALALGARLPVGPLLREPSLRRASILGGFGFTQLFDGVESEGFLGGNIGVELVF